MSTIKRFISDESGATAIEYGLIAAGISVAIITVVFSVGTNLEGTFVVVKKKLETVATP
jgi:pilus assembly protein Flp/PilA